MTKKSNLIFFGLKWDASVSSGNIRSISCAVNLFVCCYFFCIPKFTLTVKYNTLQIKIKIINISHILLT